MKTQNPSTRRQFLRTSGNSIALLTLVDLLPATSAFAEFPDDCSNYQAGDSTCNTAGDSDEACGGDLTHPGLNSTQHDADEGCNSGNAQGETAQSDAGCNETNGLDSKDPDSHCNPFPGASNEDASCEQTDNNTLDNFDEHNDPGATIT